MRLGLCAGKEASGRDDSQRFEVTKSVKPAATIVCEAKAADSIEIFIKESKRNCKKVVEIEIPAKLGLIKLAAENILNDYHMKDFPPEGHEVMKRLQLTH